MMGRRNQQPQTDAETFEEVEAPEEVVEKVEEVEAPEEVVEIKHILVKPKGCADCGEDSYMSIPETWKDNFVGDKGWEIVNA